MSKFPAVKFEAFKDDRAQMVYNARIAYEPSVFQGTGEERRVNIVLEVDDSITDAIKEMETQLGQDAHSCVNGRLVKCKLNKDSVKIYDVDGKPTKAPPTWRGMKIHACLNIKGKWSTRTQSGLCIEVPHIQLQEEDATCPF